MGHGRFSILECLSGMHVCIVFGERQTTLTRGLLTSSSQLGPNWTYNYRTKPDRIIETYLVEFQFSAETVFWSLGIFSIETSAPLQPRQHPSSSLGTPRPPSAIIGTLRHPSAPFGTSRHPSAPLSTRRHPSAPLPVKPI